MFYPTPHQRSQDWLTGLGRVRPVEFNLSPFLKLVSMSPVDSQYAGHEEWQRVITVAISTGFMEWNGPVELTLRPGSTVLEQRVHA